MRICVVGGLGYVGIAASTGLARLGHQVTAIDADPERVRRLQEQDLLPYDEPGLPDAVAEVRQAGRLRLATPQDAEEDLRAADVIFICVGTPSSPTGAPELSQVSDAAHHLGRVLAGGEADRFPVIAVKSTVPPGTAEQVERLLWQAMGGEAVSGGRTSEKSGREAGNGEAGQGAGKQAGKEASTPPSLPVASCPEFLREGHALDDFLHPSRIVIGSRNARAARVLRQLFEPLGAPILVTTPRNAEMVKYASNAFLATRISFANEIANLCDVVGADVEVVLRGMAMDPRIGPHAPRPGIGFGGPCLKKDLQAAVAFAEMGRYSPQLLEAVLAVNDRQPTVVIDRLRSLLGQLGGMEIAVWGVTFKAGTSDCRNSPALAVIPALMAEAARVRVYDPMARDCDQPLLRGVRWTKSALAAARGADAVVILTDWPQFARVNLKRLHSAMRRPVIVDGRNVLDPVRVMEAGFRYRGVGR